MGTMRRPSSDVKGKRSYDGRARREQARRNQVRIVEAAEQLFLANGYSTTTVAAIAHEAGVSADMIYKTFGGKPGLVRAIRDRALEGRGEIPAEARSDALQEHEPDPRKIIAGWGALVAEIAPRGAPIMLLVRDLAATDPEGRQLLAEMDGDRLRRMTENARRLRNAGHLRKGITLAYAANVLWTYSSAELYELLVLRRGWSPKRYGQFVAEAMSAALL